MSIFGKGVYKLPSFLPVDKIEQKTNNNLKYGFDALGFYVPHFRRINAKKALVNMGVTNKEALFFAVHRSCEYILKDDPHACLEYLAKYIDVTGCYMILSYLLTDKPETKNISTK